MRMNWARQIWYQVLKLDPIYVCDDHLLFSRWTNKNYQPVLTIIISPFHRRSQCPFISGGDDSMGLNFYFKLTKQRARSRVSSAYIPPHAVASGREMHNFYFIFLPHTSHTRAAAAASTQWHYKNCGCCAPHTASVSPYLHINLNWRKLPHHHADKHHHHISDGIDESSKADSNSRLETLQTRARVTVLLGLGSMGIKNKA
jgi:hypothetical protein